jgi:hypothetical protein
MSKVLRADATGCVIHEGTAFDPALMANPMSAPDRIYFHHDFNYYGVVAMDLAKVINHAAVPLAAFTGYDGDTLIGGQAIVADSLLLTHGLGYVPKFFCAYAGQMIPHGYPVQIDAGDRMRFVAAYATTTQIRLWEIGFSSGSAALSAASRTYSVLVFRSSVADPALPMLRLAADDVIYAQGKFNLDQAHLRIAGAGDGPFAIGLARAADINNGGIRIMAPNGAVLTFGAYASSIAAPAVINVGV